MAGRSDIEAGKAHIRLYVKKSELQQGLGWMSGQLKGIGSQVMRVGGMVAGLGTAILAPFALALGTFTAVGGSLADMSARTGIAASSLGELGFAAKQTGASLEDVEAGTRRMQKTIAEAAQGNKAAKEALAALGLTAEDLKGKLPDEQLALIGERLIAIEDPARRTEATMAALGKSGTKLLPMLENLKALREEAQALGIAPLDKSVAMADQLGDAFDAVRAVGKAAAFEIGAALAPAILPAAEAVKNIAGSVNLWVRENGALVRTVAAVGLGVLALGGIIAAAGAGLFVMGAAISTVLAAAAALGTVLGALVSPIGLVIAALAAGAVAWARYTASGRAAISYLSARLGEFLAFGREVFGGIADALMAGDLALAGRVAMAGLMVAVRTGQLAIITSWEDLKLRVFGIWDELSIQAQAAVAFIAGAFTSFGEQIGVQWSDISAALTGVWIGFETAAIAAFQGAMKAAMGFLTMMKLVTAGITAAFSEAQKLTPGAVSTALAGANVGAKATTGIDFAKIITDAEAARAETEARLRGGAAGRQMEREAGRAGAIEAAATAAAQARSELDTALEEARKARRAAEARKAGGGAAGPDAEDGGIVAEIKQKALVTFSAASLVASGGGDRLVEKQIRLAEQQVAKAELIHQDLVTLKNKPPPGLRE